MKAEDIFRWLGLDPADAHFHELDMVTEEAKREHAEYLEMLSRSAFTLDARRGHPVVFTLDTSPVTASRSDGE